MANRFLVAGGTGNWNSTTNWSATTGGPSGASFPVAGDVVAFDSNSGATAMTVNVASACASLVMSGTYTGTLTFDSTLTLTSTCTFLSGCTISGTAGTLIITGTSTLTSGGKTLTCPLTLNANATTYTLGDNWAVNGLFTITPGAGTITVNGNQITSAGGFSLGGGSGPTAGTTKLVLAGGTWSNTGSGNVGNSIDLAGNVTISGAIAWRGATLKYVSGTITTTGSTLTTTSSSTFDTAGVIWNNLTWTSITATLTSAIAYSGTLTLGTVTISGAAASGTGAVTINSGATVTLNNTGGLVTTGTMTLPNGACTFAGSAGFTVGTLTTASLTASRIHTLTFGNTYRVTTAFGNLTTSTFRQALQSSSPGNKVIFTVDPGATLTLAYCDPTDINSSGGGTVTSIGATITTSVNWTNDYKAGSVAGGAVGPVFGSSFINSARV